AKLHRANVNFLSEPIEDGTTGAVIVLTIPDAQRTMLAYQTNIFVIKGYLFELLDTIRTIIKACEEARRGGALVAVTASDGNCWQLRGFSVRALWHFSSKESSVSATRYLSHFVPLVSVTDGHRGSYLGVKGEAVYIPPPCVPVDTGAGDAFASGILYGILRSVSELKVMGTLAARIAATDIGQQGTRLSVQDAVDIAESFAFNFGSSSVRSDVGSGHIPSL
ncbi:hypothetical protein Goshw_018734, partial [Gossypium schwendimanii]|nr:hypothetical protein [Gossypium schwendimanii]